MELYDLCIVGGGMIGAAAARHASLQPGIKVCLIGLEEQTGITLQDARYIFGAHYDEGRITRSCDSDPVWAVLAQRSIERYRDLEKESGISFYTEIGCIMAGGKNTEFINNIKKNAKDHAVNIEEMAMSDLRNRFPYLKMSNNDVGIYEPKDSGHISPRKIVAAQKTVALKHGCTVFDDAVCDVVQVVEADGTSIMQVTTETGRKVLSKSVLLAPGAYTTFRKLLPPGLQPDQQLCPLTVSLVEIDNTFAEELKGMPPVIYSGQGHEDWHSEFPRYKNGNVSFYMLPPIKYPDGRFYIKLGHFHDIVMERLTTPSEVKKWFAEGNEKLARTTADFISSLYNGIKPKSWHGDYCVIVETSTNRPYIDMVHSQLGVAIGGNGYAAKSSDEIGRLAANMALGKWDSDIPRDVFKLRLMNKENGPTKTKSML